jgi:hypothetical protein
MRWFGVTVALLAASALLVAWIYLRDRHTSNWQPSQAALAHADAATVLAALQGYHCHRGCTFKLLGHSRGPHWLARINLRSDSRCFDIDVKAFAFSPQQGLSGIEQISCSTATGTAT